VVRTRRPAASRLCGRAHHPDSSGTADHVGRHRPRRHRGAASAGARGTQGARGGGCGATDLGDRLDQQYAADELFELLERYEEAISPAARFRVRNRRRVRRSQQPSRNGRSVGPFRSTSTGQGLGRPARCLGTWNRASEGAVRRPPTRMVEARGVGPRLTRSSGIWIPRLYRGRVLVTMGAPGHRCARCSLHDAPALVRGSSDVLVRRPTSQGWRGCGRKVQVMTGRVIRIERDVVERPESDLRGALVARRAHRPAVIRSQTMR